MSLIVIAGATASGKSQLALRMAQQLDGVVVNCDAMQCYEDLAIVTNRPDEEACGSVPHYLYGYRRGNDVVTAASWAQDAARLVETWLDNGRCVIVCGGSGLYIQTLLYGIHDMPQVAEEHRRAARHDMEKKGVAGVYQELQTHDSVTAADLHPHDRQRITRAWEIWLATKQSLRQWQQGDTKRSFLRDARAFVIFVSPPRDALHQRIEARIEQMVTQGALAEVEVLQRKGYDAQLPIMKSHGVPEIMAYLKGEISRDEMINQWRRVTKQYARRQMTWMRHRPPHSHHVIRQLDAQLDECSVRKALFSYEQEHGKTKR